MAKKLLFSAPETWCFSLVWVQDSLLACSREIQGSNIEVPQNSGWGPESVLLSTALWWCFGHSAALRECKICKENIFPDKEWLGSTVKKAFISFQWNEEHPYNLILLRLQSLEDYNYAFLTAVAVSSFLLRMSISGALAPGRLDAGGQAADWDHSPSCSLDYSKLRPKHSPISLKPRIQPLEMVCRA